jgi:hypothetical protein
MKPFLLLFTMLVGSLALAQSHRVVVERQAPVADTTQVAPDTLRRMVIDPSQLVYQMKVDSINQATEEKIRTLISRMEKKFEDPKVEEEVGRLIGGVVMEQQMALLDLQIDRAISMKDSLLLKGLEVALQELLQNNDVIREQVQKQLDALEKEMNKP